MIAAITQGPEFSSRWSNMSCIKSIQNACFQDWSKHIELWFHFLQEKIDLQELELHFTSIETMWTDILTKSLPKPKHGLCFQARAYFNTSAVKGGVIIDNWFQLHSLSYNALGFNILN
jgi:hypothetical protein